jgi:hypothetical protein
MDVTSGPDPAFVPAASSREPPQVTDEIERVARACFAAHHHCGPTEAAYEEPNWGRGGFKTERVVWDAVARAAIAAIASIRKDDELREVLEEARELLSQAGFSVAFIDRALSSVAGGGG